MTNTEPPHLGLAMIKPLADNWWLILLRGVLAIVFGIIALIFPGVALVTFIWIFAVFAFVDGIFSIGAAISTAAAPTRPCVILMGLPPAR